MSSDTHTLGKYRILEEIGHGGFATVYQAEDISLERTVALKVLDPLLTRDPGLISRFQQEAKVTAKLFHPNIAALFEVGAVDGRYFLAMQYIAGKNLRDLMQTQSLLPLDQMAAIIQQIGAALDYAHAQGIVHRDVKPSNIIVDEAGHATLTDFGIVKVFESTTLQTTSGAIFGTPAYSSPEQVESRPLDGRSDLYSLGVVAYELCTGKVPFAADTIPSLYYKIVHETPLIPSQVNARAANPIEAVLLKAIAKQPDQRYQSGQVFAAELNAAVEKVKGEQLDALYQQAVTLSNQKDFDSAETILQQVLAIKPEHQDAATLLERIRKRREAAKRYQDLAEAADKLRAQAAEFKQANPDVDDPAGILGAAIVDPDIAPRECHSERSEESLGRPTVPPVQPRDSSSQKHAPRSNCDSCQGLVWGGHRLSGWTVSKACVQLG
jgi:serine/threonine protein kinase